MIMDFSLNETTSAVEAALCDDFDTAKAVKAIEDLIHVTNKEIGQTPHNVIKFIILM